MTKADMILDQIRQEIEQVGEPTDIPGVSVLRGKEPGLSVGLMGMLHGDEHAGMGIWDIARRIREPNKGNIFLIVGHPDALFQPSGSKRSLVHDINRLFDDNFSDGSMRPGADHARCRTLVDFLPKLDLLIDFHSTSARTEPFVIVPETQCAYLDVALSLPITQLFGLERFLAYTATNWLTRRGKTGIMVEVGQHQDPNSRQIAADIAYRVLDKLQMIGQGAQTENGLVSYSKRHICVLDQMRVKGSAFEFRRDCDNFDSLEPGETIAHDTARQYIVPQLPNLVLCLPTAIELLKDNIGTEAFYLGVDVSFMGNALSRTLDTIC